MTRHTIPRRYAGKDVLYDILLISIRDNWDRIRDYYQDVLDYLETSEKDIDIDRVLLSRLRKDIKADGDGFLTTPDGLASRLKDYIIEGFPQVFK